MFEVTVIQSLTPIFKPILSYEGDRTGVRPNAKEIYTSNADGEQRFAVPTGRGDYDIFVYLKCWGIHNSIDTMKARHLAEHVPKTTIELRARHLVRNTIYYIMYHHMTGGLFHQSKTHGAFDDREYLYIFKYDQPEEGVIAWMRRGIGKYYERKAEGIRDSLARKHIPPYKDLKRILEFFEDIAHRLIKLGQKGPALLKAAQKTKAPAPVLDKPLSSIAAGQVIHLTKTFFPSILEPVRTLLSLSYSGIPWIMPTEGGIDNATA